MDLVFFFIYMKEVNIDSHKGHSTWVRAVKILKKLLKKSLMYQLYCYANFYSWLGTARRVIEFFMASAQKLFGLDSFVEPRELLSVFWSGKRREVLCSNAHIQQHSSKKVTHLIYLPMHNYSVKRVTHPDSHTYMELSTHSVESKKRK